MRSENTHPVAHAFNGEAFPLLAVFRFLESRWRLTLTGTYSPGKISCNRRFETILTNGL